MKHYFSRPPSKEILIATLATFVVVVGWLGITKTPTGETELASIIRSLPRRSYTPPPPPPPPASTTRRSTAARSTTAASGNGLNLGINLDGPAYWSPLGSHCDATTAFSPWMEPGTTDYGTTGLYVTDPSKLTKDNYPLKNADSITLLLGYNSGPFNVSFEGSGTVTIQGKSDWSKSGNRSTGTVTLQSGNLSLIQIRNVDTSNPIKNLKIIPANELECVAGNTYRNLFITKLTPFKTLRFMDWQSTNESQIVNWSDRSPKTAFGHMGIIPSKMGNAGLAYEDLIELANVTGKDIWINVPAHASDDFMRQFARLLKNNLNANSKVYVEYSNEVWNSIFEQHRYAKERGHAVSPWPNASDTEVAGYYYGMQTKKMADIFKSEFGASEFERRVYPVLGSNIVGSYWPYWGFAAIGQLYPNETGVTPGSKNNIRAIAVNPYLGSDQLDQVSPGGDFFDKMKKIVTEKNAVWLADMKRVNTANGINLPYVIYESGQHLVGKSYNGQNYHDALNDPKMADVYKTLYTWWNNENPGQPAVHFAFISKQGRDADYHWGLFENMNQTTSVRYQALLDLAGSNGTTPPPVVTPPPTTPPPPPEVICPTTYTPVCGADTKNYSNSCNATKANTTVAYLGMCQTTRMGDLEILTSSYNRTDCAVSNSWCNGADLDTNGTADFNELVKISQNFNRTDCRETNNWCDKADINKDGRVTQFAPGAATSKGDFNDDGAINTTDLDILIKTLGKAQGDSGYNAVADLVKDNVIDRKDYTKFMSNYKGDSYQDADGDGDYTQADLDFVLSRVGATRGDNRYNVRADMNKDNVIDNTDVTVISIMLNIKVPDASTGLTPGLTATFYNNPTSLTTSLGSATVPNINFWYGQSAYSQFPVVSQDIVNAQGFSARFKGKILPKKDANGSPILGANTYQLCVHFSGFMKVDFNNSNLWNMWVRNGSDPGYPPYAECKAVPITENKPYDLNVEFGKGYLMRLYWRVNGVEQSMTESLFH